MNTENKQNFIPQILVFGGADAPGVAKILWTQLPDLSIKVVPVAEIRDVQDMALNAVMVFWLLDDNLSLIHGVLQQLAADPLVTAEMTAITREQQTLPRIKLMSAGFDTIFTRDVIESKEFQAVLRNKVSKGLARLMRRVREEEYLQLKAALSISPDAYIIFDGDKRITFLSDHYHRVYPNSAPKMVPGTHIDQALKWVFEETGVDETYPDYDRIVAFWRMLVPGTIEFSLKNNSILRVKATALPYGRGTIVTTTNVTEYKRIANLLEQKSAALEHALESEKEANAIQRQFIAMVSHEFRTPLTIIDGNAQLIERQAKPDTIEQILKRARTIRSGVSRLVQMMEGVLSSSLARTGKLELTLAPFDLRALITELCAEQRDLAQGITVDVACDALPESVQQDKKLLTLVLTNLIANAVKFSPYNPRVQVSARLQDGEIVVQVADNGIGIPASEVGRVFDKFFRASNATTIPGTGFGMALTRDLVRTMGGQIVVESQQGQGTIFTVTLPVVQNEV